MATSSRPRYGLTLELLGVSLGLGIVIEGLFLLAGLTVITLSLRIR